jgi:uncharacterized protein
MESQAASEARVATPLAQRYMTQLCKHFEHRLAVSYDTAAGRIAFPSGLCRLEAGPDVLVLHAEAADPGALDQLESVVARHLERFAFRDKPAIVWQRAAA